MNKNEQIRYPNYLSEIGITVAETADMVRRAFDTIFFDPEENFCHHTDEDAWCMVDTGNVDARTEGMSYGMMMCVQMDRQDIFDKLWTFADRYMRLHSGPCAGYFAWSVQLDGKHNAEGPAPDGEEYFAMALLMASARWGDGEGLYHYSDQAREILRHVLHQHELVPGGEPMWEPANHYIRFVPNMKISDPSYHLPHFYDLFAEKADEQDRDFWKKAAEASRKYIVRFIPGDDTATGEMPDEMVDPDSDFLLPDCDYSVEGKTFAEWYVQIGNLITFGRPGDVIAIQDDTTVTAIWADNHTITYASGDGDASFYIINEGSGKYLTANGGAAEGTTYTQKSKNNTAAQKFKFLIANLNKGKVKIINVIKPLDRWYIRKVLKKDFGFTFQHIREGKDISVGKRRITFRENGDIAVDNDRYNIHYVFTPITASNETDQ